jgi:hypothetical protein
MSDDKLLSIDRNRLVKKYPYVRAPKKEGFISDTPSFDPNIDGYYINGQLSDVPDGLWFNGDLIEVDLSEDFFWIDSNIVPVDEMYFGINWSELSVNENDDGEFGQATYADGEGNIIASTILSIDDINNIIEISGNFLPDEDLVYNIGSDNLRFANIYTGDLHLRNDRGHWQIIEEADYLTITNKLNGKKYKFVLELLNEENNE